MDNWVEKGSQRDSIVPPLSLPMSLGARHWDLTPHPSLGISASAKSAKCKCKSLCEDYGGIKILYTGC